MLKRLTLVLLLASGPAFAQAAVPTAFSETQSCSAGTCTASAPTSTSDGMSIIGVAAFRLSVCAVAGQTLSGAGTLQAYFCDSRTSLCMRNKGLDVSVNASGARCQVFPDFQVASVTLVLDSVVFRATGVTVSGGANVTVSIYPFLLLR